MNRITITGIIESIIFNLLIFLLFYVMPSNQEGFLTLNLHPLFLLTAMIALRYGNIVGVFSAAIASVLYLSAYYLLGKDLLIFFSEFSNYKFILMFFLSAIILGHYRDAFRIKVDHLRSDNLLLVKNVTHLKQGYDEERKIKDELRKQIIGAKDTIFSLHHIAKLLEATDTETLYSVIPEVMMKFIMAQEVSVYLLTPDKQGLTIKLRTLDSNLLPDDIDLAGETVWLNIINNKRAFKNKDGIKNMPILVAPIICENEVVAIVNVESLKFEMLTEYTFYLFVLITEWLSEAMDRASLMEHTACLIDQRKVLSRI